MTGEQASRACVTRPGPGGGNAAEALPQNPSGRWTARRAVAYAMPALWALGVLLWELLLPVSTHFVALLAVTPALAGAGTGGRTGVLVGGGCALLALYPLGAATAYEALDSRAGLSAAILVVAVVSCHGLRRRARLTDELVRTREVATAAQQALIRPLPPRMEGFTVASGYLSAAPGAAVGGDLYDAVVTAHGVRVLIGDVRGHGLGAVSTVAAVLGSFREAAHDEPRLEQVPHRLQRALDRHLGAGRQVPAGDGAGAVRCPGAGIPSGAVPCLSSVAPPGGPAGAADRERAGAAAGAPERIAQPEPVNEEFVTALVLEVRTDDTVAAVNCGHPWPYRLTAGHGGRSSTELLSTAEPLPPLGLVPLPPDGPEPLRLRLPPGEALFLYTDGAEDARDASGRYFPLGEALTAALSVRRRGCHRSRGPESAAAAHPADVVESVRRSLLRHSGGRPPDDVALLALRNDRCRVHGHDPARGAVSDRESVPVAEARPGPERAGTESAGACSCP